MEMMRHGWTVSGEGEAAEFVRSAAGAVAAAIAARIGDCNTELVPALGEPELTSEWFETEHGIEVRLATGGADPHDVALEFLYCLGQAVWERMAEEDRAGWLRLLRSEILAGVKGEIDEDALESKRALLAAPDDPERLETYAAMAFASTLAEFIHTAWHDTTLRTGPEHLAREWLDGRFNWLARML